MSAPANQPQTISLSDLEIPQLAEIRKQLEEELSLLSNSFAQLKSAQAKFRSCVENVAEVKPQNKGKTILVPLTNSLYVPGKLSDLENVIVDVGTGYYVKKPRAQAVKHYESKVEYIGTNIVALQQTIQQKQDNLNAILSVLQNKLQAQTAPKDTK
ncbi:unnamed protein product [Somion occarium]|uniref:Prefoldin subunit 5 n=1 Tax=Somion occarium TaxID=3059160 RepID=A0ABP1D1T7_9APHY